MNKELFYAPVGDSLDASEDNSRCFLLHDLAHFAIHPFICDLA